MNLPRTQWCLLLTAMCLIGFPGCNLRIGNWRIGGGPTLRGNGNIATEERLVEEFTSIDVSGAMQVSIELGNEPALSITADENLLEVIESTVINGRLVLRNLESYSSSNPVVIKVSTQQLKSYDGSGATTGIIAGSVETDVFEVDLSGASRLTLGSGTTGKLKANLSGASSLKASELVAGDADIDVSGASSAITNVTGSLDAEASGASSVRYSGDPKSVKERASGGSSVRASGQ